MPDSQECDRCGATIVVDYATDRPMTWQFVFEGDEPREYHTEDRTLCKACESKMLEWIDGEDPTSNAVDLPSAYATGETFRRFAEELEDMADTMQDA